VDESTYDELPLWSAPFGQALLDAVVLRPGLTVLDVGFGAGFPALELAERLGASARVYGVDPGAEGVRRARAKAAAYGVANLLLLRAGAEHLPLASEAIGLVVSNNGFNNVQDLEAALREARRVCRAGAQLVATQNLPDTMRLFYDCYEAALRDSGLAGSLPGLQRHIHERRRPREEMAALLGAAGFAVRSARETSFSMRYLDGTTLLAHHFIRLGFLPAWRAVPPAVAVDAVFARLESRLNQVAAERGELRLDIPFVCFDCRAR
jgi:SAM-dependent methyltransferase